MSQAITDTAFSIERMSFGGAASPPEPAKPAPPAAPLAPPAPPVAAADEAIANRLIRQLADDIARAMGAALQELDRQRQAESNASANLADRIEFLASGLDQVRQTTEQLVATVSEQGSSIRTAGESCDDLSARVVAVVERLDRHAEALRGLADFRHNVTGAAEQIAVLAARLQETAPQPAWLESL